jgi:transposase
VILDNYAIHKHPKVRGWLARHPRVTFHFTPTSRSWANAVEGWFARLTRQRLKRGVFTSIIELQTAILRVLYKPMINPLSELLGRDLSPWLDWDGQRGRG